MLPVELGNAVLDGALLHVSRCWSEAETGERHILGHRAAAIERALCAGGTDRRQVAEGVADAIAWRIDADLDDTIRRSLAAGDGIRETAREMGCGHGTVRRVNAELEAAVKA